mgnify:CR=1 FL=1
MRPLLDPDIVIRTAPDFPGGGEFRGQKAIDWFSDQFEEAWKSVLFEVSDMRAEADTVVVEGAWVVRGRESDAPMRLDFWATIRTRGDKVAALIYNWTEEEAMAEARGGGGA